jgi:hypothetical protein
MANEQTSFSYKQVSEKEKEKIKKDSKKLLDKFSNKLEKVKTKEAHFSSDTSPSGVREEGNGWETDKTFKDIMLTNAPFVEDDSIIAEKAGWKK